MRPLVSQCRRCTRKGTNGLAPCNNWLIASLSAVKRKKRFEKEAISGPLDIYHL